MGAASAYWKEQFGKAYRKESNTKPPRTREGQKHPGGKRMRKAMQRLEARQRGYETILKGKGVNPAAYQKPGSMKS